MYYIDRTKPFRKSDQFFVAFAKPHKGYPISEAGIARWIVKCIQTSTTKLGESFLFPPRVHSTRKKGEAMIMVARHFLKTLFQTSAQSTV